MRCDRIGREQCPVCRREVDRIAIDAWLGSTVVPFKTISYHLKPTGRGFCVNRPDIEGEE